MGARYSVTSGSLRVLMDQPTEPISSYDALSRHDDRWLARPERRRLPQGACQTLAICQPPGVSSSPHGYSAPSSPPRGEAQFRYVRRDSQGYASSCLHRSCRESRSPCKGILVGDERRRPIRPFPTRQQPPRRVLSPERLALGVAAALAAGQRLSVHPVVDTAPGDRVVVCLCGALQALPSCFGVMRRARVR